MHNDVRVLLKYWRELNGPGVGSASNKICTKGISWGVKAAGA